MKLVVGITGASGTVMGEALLNELRFHKIETHYVVSKGAYLAHQEEEKGPFVIHKGTYLTAYPDEDLAAPISSGSFQHSGMIILPCSINTMSCIANSITPNLICRAADVTLKERRRLILVVREGTVHSGHLENMKRLSDRGAIIMFPVLNFYSAERQRLTDQVQHIISRVLNHFPEVGFDSGNYSWKEK
jgi:4-hydroxy-3-polyprenylbenzoate decarboxylase